MDDPLRVALWNWTCWALESAGQNDYDHWYGAARQGLWDAFFHLCNDDIPHLSEREWVKNWFFQASWFDVYNFIEFVLNHLEQFLGPYNPRKHEAEDRLNGCLERQLSGYRAMHGVLAPISSQVEVDEVKQAATPVAGFQGVATHIQTALELLGKKPDPDYRNSIKESISAVEAATKLLTGEKSGGLNPALAILEKKGHLHHEFKKGVSALYNYTSDEDGIRHAILEEANIAFAEAKFMLVACSAFANFLIDSGRPVVG
jgi:hypothetical protein